MNSYNECFITVRVGISDQDLRNSGTPQSVMVAAHQKSELLAHRLRDDHSLNANGAAQVIGIEVR